MVNAGNRREHSNLYYILEADKQAHPMPVERVELLRETFFEIFSQNIKPMADPVPPC